MATFFLVLKNLDPLGLARTLLCAKPNSKVLEPFQEYALSIKHILEMSPEGIERVCDRARSYVDLFSEKEFVVKWLRATESLLN